ncbi:phosphonate ABC transporter substrate-binding protein [Rhodanobacter sp. C03]|nr:phosphonate ABC transporter substrate-binding protein [Rhodanobacter sp. C03]
MVVLLALNWLPLHAATAHAGKPQAALTFGILPIGGPSESLDAWRPMLDDMGKALQRPIHSISVSTYEGLAQAMSEERVDIAFVSGVLALDAVNHDRMQVIAQLTRGDGSRGYYSVLLVQKDSPIRTLDDLYRQPGHWRFARGEALSTSGYLVPETQLFASHKLDSDTFFANVVVNNHQNNALSVANGEVDVATNNTADLERFAQHFPEQYARLRILWKSTLIPHAVIIVRKDLAPQLRTAIVDFITHYAKTGPNAAAELGRLKLIHDISGFAPAGDAMLAPFADVDYTLERRRALSAQWVNDAAMQARLQKIEYDHQQLLHKLKANSSMDLPNHGDQP